jgi:hypothetical protein
LLDYIETPTAFTQQDEKGDTALYMALCAKYVEKDKKEKIKLMTEAMRKMGIETKNYCKKTKLK